MYEFLRDIIWNISVITSDSAGKTLASLGYALKVAAKRKTSEVSHIFYISPYISITEQSTEVIKKQSETKNG